MGGCSFCFYEHLTFFYTSRIIIVTMAAVTIAVEVFHVLYYGDVKINIDASDHFGRVGIVLLVLFISMVANTLLRSRLSDNHYRINEIEEKNLKLSSLYTELQDKEKKLKLKHEELNNSFKEIDHLAHYDSLTELPKRKKLYEDIEGLIQAIKANNTNEQFTLILIDLDNFKVINDLHGHEVGDHYLVHTADMLRSLVKPYESTVYRIGSDDFVILTQKTSKPEPVLPILNALLTNFEVPMEYELYSIRTTISIGVCDYPPHSGNHGKVLLRNADIALNHAKVLGKSNYVFF